MPYPKEKPRLFSFTGKHDVQKYLKRYGGILLGSGVVFFGILLLTHTQTKNATLPKPSQNVTYRGTRRPLSTSQETLTDFQTIKFYRTIVDNNLFRPLGWRPPRPREPSRLIGTLIPTDANTPKQAILQKTRAGRTYTVTIGDKLDENTTVTNIQSKQVTLETNGQQRTLILNTTLSLK